MKMEANKPKRLLVAQVDYCSIASCWTKNFRDISLHIWKFSQYFKCLSIHFTLFCGTLDGKSWIGAKLGVTRPKKRSFIPSALTDRIFTSIHRPDRLPVHQPLIH
jgi:hypothetical protein